MNDKDWDALVALYRSTHPMPKFSADIAEGIFREANQCRSTWCTAHGRGAQHGWIGLYVRYV
jgi:SH3-like domain-containing protein